jgi:hypothetical protein
MGVLDSEKNPGAESLGSRPAYLKIHAINLSMPLPEGELLRFSTTVRTVNNKSHTAYTLFNSGASHRFVDISFLNSQPIVPRNYGSMVLTTADQTSRILD